jgi:hypothetical protein|tara:strand:- start:676 stop:1044 length:369 start_codon:yes stop_codon:yes gene_type:complete
LHLALGFATLTARPWRGDRRGILSRVTGLSLRRSYDRHALCHVCVSTQKKRSVAPTIATDRKPSDRRERPTIPNAPEGEVGRSELNILLSRYKYKAADGKSDNVSTVVESIRRFSLVFVFST